MRVLEITVSYIFSLADVFAKIYYERFKRMFETNHRDLVLDEMNEDMLKAEERSVKLINFPVEANVTWKASLRYLRYLNLFCVC